MSFKVGDRVLYLADGKEVVLHILEISRISNINTAESYRALDCVNVLTNEYYNGIPEHFVCELDELGKILYA